MGGHVPLCDAAAASVETAAAVVADVQIWQQRWEKSQNQIGLFICQQKYDTLKNKLRKEEEGRKE